MATLISGSTGVNKITDGTITNADIASGAAIAGSKLVMPTGSVLQVVSAVMTSSVAFTVYGDSATFVTILSGSITPKFANSKFIINGVAPNYSNSAGGGAWSNSCYIRLYEQEGSSTATVVAGYEHQGTQTNEARSQVSPVLYSSEAKSTIQSYTYSIRSAATTDGDTHTFGRTAGGYAAFSRMTITEIAG